MVRAGCAAAEFVVRRRAGLVVQGALAGARAVKSLSGLFVVALAGSVVRA